MASRCISCNVDLLPKGTKRFTTFAKLDKTNITIGDYLLSNNVYHNKDTRVCRQCVYTMSLDWRSSQTASNVKTAPSTSWSKSPKVKRVNTPTKSTPLGKKRLLSISTPITPAAKRRLQHFSPVKTPQKLR